MVWFWTLIFSRQVLRGLQFFNYLFFSSSKLLLPAMCPSPQFTHLDSFVHWLVLPLVWSSFPQFWQTSFRLHVVFMRPYLWHLWHTMARFWYLYTAVSDGYPGIQKIYGSSYKLKVKSTAVALDFFDFVKLASIAFLMNGYDSFRVLFISSLNSQFCR